MSSSKKRARSPEVDGRPSKRQRASDRIHQQPPLRTTRWRGPKDDRMKALRNLQRKRRSEVFRYTPYIPINPPTHQPSHTTPAPGESPLQNSPGHAVTNSPPPLLAGVDDGGLEGFNNSPVSPHVPLGLGSASGIRDNRALFRHAQHLDNHTPAWNRRRNNQATQWRSIAIPQLIPIYLANRAATESGRFPPLPLPNRQCQCNKVVLKVEMVTWDRKSPLRSP